MSRKLPDPGSKLEHYLVLLKKWQKSINLVSASTIEDARARHFDDSLQLAEYIPEGAKLYDLGSGAGFPGLVLAIARPDLAVTLIESDQKKCTFLSTVSRETGVPVEIVNQRIESVSRETIPAIVTARALAPLDKLLGYCLPWAQANPQLKMLFLKGRQTEEELALARDKYRFRARILPSRTAPDSYIVEISDLAVKSED